MRCNCENLSCREPHKPGDCPGDAVVPTCGGSICLRCAPYMPAEYILTEADIAEEKARVEKWLAGKTPGDFLPPPYGSACSSSPFYSECIRCGYATEVDSEMAAHCERHRREGKPLLCAEYRPRRNKFAGIAFEDSGEYAGHIREIIESDNLAFVWREIRHTPKDHTPYVLYKTDGTWARYFYWHQEREVWVAVPIRTEAQGIAMGAAATLSGFTSAVVPEADNYRLCCGAGIWQTHHAWCRWKTEGGE